MTWIFLRNSTDVLLPFKVGGRGASILVSGDISWSHRHVANAISPVNPQLNETWMAPVVPSIQFGLGGGHLSGTPSDPHPLEKAKSTNDGNYPWGYHQHTPGCSDHCLDTAFPH